MFVFCCYNTTGLGSAGVVARALPPFVMLRGFVGDNPLPSLTVTPKQSTVTA
jgi:hypothetical protein